MDYSQLYREAIVHLSFFIPFILVVVIIFIILRHAFRKKKIIDGTYHETTFLDDYYPSQRKIKYESSALPESGIHRKLNYQYVIESMTRKLFYVLIVIVILSFSFAYTLYNTSISERIAPDKIVMEQYAQMVNKIMLVEDSLEQTQIAPVRELFDKKVIPDSTKTKLIEKIVNETVTNEDALVLSVSKNFFSIYYVRYILVRILIALVIIGLIRYFISLYFRIQQERLDLIRKEEALSTLFYMLESKDGQIDKEGKITKKYANLKIPPIPLNKLFDPSYTNINSKNRPFSKKTEEATENLHSLIKSQREFYENLLAKFETKKENG